SRGEKPHRTHELIDRNLREDLDVLEIGSRLRGRQHRRLRGEYDSKRDGAQPGHGGSYKQFRRNLHQLCPLYARIERARNMIIAPQKQCQTKAGLISGSATDSGLMRKREETGGLGEIW